MIGMKRTRRRHDGFWRHGLHNWCLIALIALSGLAGCAHQREQAGTSARPDAVPAAQDKPAPVARTSTPQKYLLGVNDELEIKFVDRPKMNEAVKVRPDGMISLGLIGSIRAEGRTPQELEDELASRYRALGDEGNATPEKRNYLIRPDDELDIKFSYMRQLNDTVVVLPDGKISLQLVNAVVAAGKSPEDLSRELTKLYSRHVRMPELVVIVKKSSSPSYVLDGRPYRADSADLKPVVIVRSYAVQQVFVGGEVGRPGVLAYRNSLTLSQAIIEAGGDRPSGDMENVMILRKGEDGQPVVIRHDLKANISAGTDFDVALAPSDVVVLPRSTISAVGLALDQYVFSIFPFIRNSTFSFVNDLTPSSRRQSTVTTTVIPR